MEEPSIDYSQIKGWGIDADPKNDPTYPMRHRHEGDTKRYDWNRPEQQPVDVEVLHSNERPNVTAVFGTSTPPSGLSGILRRFAFRFSESDYLHWLPLMLADRINMVEGVCQDLERGHVPNIPSELGWRAEWKHNRASLVARVLIGVTVAAVAISQTRRKSRNFFAD